MGCGVYYQQLNEIDKALRTMRRFGIDVGLPGFRLLQRERAKLLANVGVKFPRSVLSILKLAGLSQGTLTLWLDVESGWMSEARSAPGAPPVYRSIGDEVAMMILKGELTHEEFEELKVPVENIDN